MAVNLSPVAGAAAQFFDNSGNVLTGGKLYTYDAGTTTPAPTYTNSSGITAHPNPIILNAAGRVPDSGEIWLSDSVSYKFVLKDQNDVLIGTYDNLVGINSNFINFTGEEEQQTATQGQTVFTLTTLNYQPATNNLLVFVNGSKQISGTNYQETSSTIVTFVDGLNVGDVVDFCTATPINTAVVNADAVAYNEGGTGAVNRTVASKLQESISVQDFGAIGDGVTDDSAAIQSAYDYLISIGGGTLYFPRTADGYKLDSALNFSGNTSYLDSFAPVILKGDGSVDIPDLGTTIYGTTLLANTGSGTACIDIVGHENVKIESLIIDGTKAVCTTPSRIGILAGRNTGTGTFGKDQNHVFNGLSIFLPTTSSPTLPSIAFYSVGTEICEYNNCSFFADLPHALVANNNTTNVPYSVSSAFTTLNDGPVSCSLNSYNNCIFSTQSLSFPIIHFDSVYAITMINSYFGQNVVGTVTNQVIYLTGGNIKDLIVQNFVNEVEASLIGGNIQELKNSTFIGQNNYFNVADRLANFTVTNIFESNTFKITDSSNTPYQAYNINLGKNGVNFYAVNNLFDLGGNGQFVANYATGAVLGSDATIWSFVGFSTSSITFNGRTTGSDSYSVNGIAFKGTNLIDGTLISNNNKTITSTPSVIATSKTAAGLAFVQVYNNIGGDTGNYLVSWNYTVGAPTIISSANQTGLTFNFTKPAASNDLLMDVTSGSATAVVTSLI